MIKKHINILKLFYTFLFLMCIYPNHCISYNVSYASENIELEKIKQIDLKTNITDGNYGRYDHYVYTLAREVTSNYLFLKVHVLDYPNYVYKIYVYDKKGNFKKELNVGTNDSYFNVYEDKYTGDILIISQREVSEEYYLTLTLLDKDLNIKASKSLNDNRESSISNVVVTSTKENYKVAYRYSSRRVEYFRFDKEIKLIESKRFSPPSSSGKLNILTHGNGEVWLSYTNKAGVNTYYYNLDTSSKLSSAKNYWKHTEDRIRNSITLKNGNELVYGSKYYMVLNKDNENNNNNNIIDEGLLNENGKDYDELILNLMVSNDKKVNVFENVDIKIYNNKILTYTNNSNDATNNVIDEISYENIIFYKKFKNEIVYKENSKNIYYIINDEGIIRKLNLDGALLYIDKDMIINSKGEKNERYMNDTIYISNVVSLITLDLTELKNNLKDNILYVGTNGIDIYGKVIENTSDIVTVSSIIAGVEKTADVNLKENNNFRLHWDITEIVDYTYSNLKIKLSYKEEKYNIAPDEIEIGKVVCTDDHKYKKLDNNVFIEEYPKLNGAYTLDEISDFDLLTKEEYEKYKSYIDNSKFNFWLMNGYAVNKNKKVSKITSSNAFMYVLSKKEIDIRKRFRYNDEDDIYYEMDDVLQKEIDLDFNVEVSKEIPKQPDVSVIPDVDYFVNDNVTVKATCNDDEVIMYYINTTDRKIYEYKNEIVIDTSGIYEYVFYTENKYGNKSEEVKKIIKIDNVKPEIKLCEFENSHDKWTKEKEVVLNLEIEDFLSGLTDETIDKYKITFLGNGIYKLRYLLKQNEKIDFEFVDNAGNVTYVSYKNEFEIDDIAPKFTCEEFIYDDEKVTINLKAIDNESGIKNIYYSINDEGFKIYEDKIILYKELYDRNTNLKYYAVDNVNNKTEIYSKNLNLNSKPKLTLMNENELKNSYCIADVAQYKFSIEDDDKNDKLDLYIEFKTNKYTYNYKYENVSNYFEFKLPEKIMEVLDYGDINYLTFKLTDGLLESYFTHSFIKENMKPKIEILNNIEEAFTDFFEIKLNIIDYDYNKHNKDSNEDNKDKTLNLKIVDENGVKIYEENVTPGENTIFLNNILKPKKQNIKFYVTDGKDKVLITKNVNVLKPLDFNNGEIIILKFKSVKTIDFYNMLHKKLNEYNEDDKDNKDTKDKNKNLLIILADEEIYEVREDNVTDNILSKDTNYYNVKLSRLFNESNLKIVDNKEFEQGLSSYLTYDNMCILGDVDENYIEKYILEKSKSYTKKVYELDEELNLYDFNFFDIESDYYVDNKGKDRIIQIYQTPFNFENTNGTIKNNGYYDIENNKWDESKYYDYYTYDITTNINEKDVDENKNELKSEVNNSCNTYERMNLKLDKIGKYILNIKEKDHIISDEKDYSLYSDDLNYEFYVHRKPVVNLTYQIINNDYVKVKKNAYDLDFYSINKGIKKEDIKITYIYKDGSRKKIEEDKTIDFEKDLFKLSDEYDIEIIYKVTDYGIDPNEVDDKYAFSTEKKILISKSEDIKVCDFNYLIGNKDALGYVYKGKDGFEKVTFEDYTNVKDSIKKEYLIEEKEFNDLIENSYHNNELTNQFIVKTDVETIYSEKKNLLVRQLILNNLSHLNYKDAKKGFVKTENAKIEVEVLNLMNDDVNVYLNDTLMMEKNNQSNSEKYDNKVKRYTLDIDISKEKEEVFYYEIKVYSKRDNTLLIKQMYSDKIYENVKMYDFNVTNVSDPNHKILAKTYYVKDLPVGNDIKVKKGYAFDFSVTTEGLDEDNDYILIKPTFYYYEDNELDRTKIDLLKNIDGKLTPYDMYIVYNSKQIGDLNAVTLSKEERIKYDDFEMWNGRFFIPYDSVVVTNEKIQSEGNIIVNFQLEAYKDGIKVLSYVPNIWAEESSESNIYNYGDVIIYSNKDNALLDVESKNIY